MPNTHDELLSRRGFLTAAGLTGLGLMAAACTPGASPAPGAATAAGGAATSAAGAATGAATAVAKKAFTPTTVKIGTIPVFEISSWQYVGVEQGFFRDFGITLDIQALNSGNLILTATQTGNVDMADGGVTDPLAAIERGAPLRILGASRPGLNFVVYARRGINSLKDLEGKTVGVAAPGSFLNALMLTLFQAQGVDASKVEFVNIGTSPQVYASVVAGRVDAGPSAVDFVPVAARDGVTPLLETWKVLPDYVRVIWYATQEGIQRRGDEMARTIAGILKSHRYMREPASRAQFVRACVEQYRTDPAVAEASWEFLRDNPIFSQDGMISERQIDYMQDITINILRSQTRKLPYNQLVDLSVVQKANEYLRG